MSEAVNDRVGRIVSAVLGIPGAAIDDETSPETVPEWDSMQHLQLILALEQEFAMQFEVEEIESMQRVGAIRRVVETRLARR